ncbi:hypothetical protein [Kiloniella sp. b19]|uniref:hypothetical protein n=1 Tax=Kiloniella sp. GXU_MW_B19 TaxID=3141326 RepID=UPI0031E29A05
MSGREVLIDWVVEALNELNGKATISQVAKKIWGKQVSKNLTEKDELFYSWQYDMRWAATALRKQKKIMLATEFPRGIWILSD